MLAVPSEVRPPYPLVRGATYLLLTWNLPAQPNGIITGYSLFFESNLVYTGYLNTFNVSGLSVRCLICSTDDIAHTS